MSDNVSIPRVVKVPRVLDDGERETLLRVADSLIPAHGDAPPAGSEPGFEAALTVALGARAEAFGDIVAALARLASSSDVWEDLRRLDEEQPVAFQALSTVIAGAWLLTPGVRGRIGYHGQQVDKAGLEEAADEIGSGVLDPVLEREAAGEGRWIR